MNQQLRRLFIVILVMFAFLGLAATNPCTFPGSESHADGA